MPSDNPQPVPQSSCGDDLDFHHPFVPYDVQLQFMRTVYGVLQQGQGQIGILESPTGTVCRVGQYATVLFLPPMLYPLT